MKISLITPVRDAVSTLPATLDSVARQNMTCEHIIVDGGSTDDSLPLITEYANRRKTDGHRVIVTSTPDRGIYDAMNRGLQLAAGEIVGVLNADDTYSTHTALQLVSQAMARPDAGACYADLRIVHPLSKATLRFWRAGLLNTSSFVNGWMPPHPTFFLRRKHYAHYGGYRLDLGTSADYELMLRMLHLNRIPAAYIPVELVTMTAGGASARSLMHRIRANRWDGEAWTKNKLHRPRKTCILKPLRKVSQFFTRGHVTSPQQEY